MSSAASLAIAKKYSVDVPAEHYAVKFSRSIVPPRNPSTKMLNDVRVHNPIKIDKIFF